jgi:hypothetical protein
MSLKFHPVNCFWLILPLAIWNVLLGPGIADPHITSDANSPQWLLSVENITRIAVFALPLLMPLPRGKEWQSSLVKAGLIIYIAGMVIYFASWMPLLLAPDSAWSNSSSGWLAPRLTPFLCFLGIAMIGQSWQYAVISILFIFFHTWHGVQNLNL